MLIEIKASGSTMSLMPYLHYRAGLLHVKQGDLLRGLRTPRIPRVTPGQMNRYRSICHVRFNNHAQPVVPQNKSLIGNESVPIPFYDQSIF